MYNTLLTFEEVAELKKSATEIFSLPDAAFKVIQNYSNLNLGGKKVTAPYYINKPDPVPTRPGEYYNVRKSLNRALVSKGNPSEIENIVKNVAARNGFILEKESITSIQNFMYTNGIGVDCSGYVVWLLNEVTKLEQNKNIWECIQIPSKNPLRKLITKLRPLENISVITLRENSKMLEDMTDVRPGDIIITRPKKMFNHILLVTKVGYKDGKPIYIDYSQATAWYSERFGIINGTIIIKNSSKYLLDQVWFEDSVKQNFTYAGAKDDPKVTKIMRLNCFFMDN